MSREGWLNYKSSRTGGRVDRPLRVRARTSSPPRQYRWRLGAGFFTACFFFTFFLTFLIAGDSPPLGPLSSNSSLANWVLLASRRCSLWTGLLKSPLCVFKVTVRRRPSLPGNNLSTRPISHFTLSALSSEISTISRTLRAGCPSIHFCRMDNWCRYSPRQRFQKWLTSFCWYR